MEVAFVQVQLSRLPYPPRLFTELLQCAAVVATSMTFVQQLLYETNKNLKTSVWAQQALQPICRPVELLPARCGLDASLYDPRSSDGTCEKM